MLPTLRQQFEEELHMSVKVRCSHIFGLLVYMDQFLFAIFFSDVKNNALFRCMKTNVQNHRPKSVLNHASISVLWV